MTKTITLYEDSRHLKEVVIEDRLIEIQLWGKHKDGTLMPISYAALNVKDLDKIHEEIKGDL